MPAKVFLIENVKAQLCCAPSGVYQLLVLMLPLSMQRITWVVDAAHLLLPGASLHNHNARVRHQSQPAAVSQVPALKALILSENEKPSWEPPEDVSRPKVRERTGDVSL